MKRILWLLALSGMLCVSSLAAKEVNIYLVRHGKTFFNATGQVQGWCDSLLTEQGITQAKRVGKALADTPFVTAFSSDAGRARATANIILKHNVGKRPPLVELAALREWGYGGFEGRDDAEMWRPIFAQAGVEFKKDWSTWEAFTQKMSDREIADAIARNDQTGTAENYAAIVARLKAGIDQIIAETEAQGGGNSLVVSHGSAIPTILTIFVPGQYHGESIANASVTVLHYNKGQFTLKMLGETGSLSQP